MIRTLPVLFLAVACTDKPAPDLCAEAGNICTVVGTGLAGLGQEDVPAETSYLYLPQDLTFGPDNQPYILDWNNHRIRTVTSDGNIHTVMGNGLLGDGPEGPALDARLNHPTNLAFDGTGKMLIAAWHNSRIERMDLTTGNMEYLCGNGGRGYNGDGIAARDATLDLPSSVVMDDNGNVIFTDQANQQVRMVDSDDIIWDMAGTQRVQGYSGDGGPADQAKIYGTVGQAADPSNRLSIDGNTLYMADSGNHVIRVIDMTTWTIDTYAGQHTCDEAGDCVAVPGTADGDRLEAQFYNPADVQVGPEGELYVADTFNSCVRVIWADGTVETVAGQCGVPGFEGDEGPAADALLYRPYGITLDRDHNLWIADTYNHRIRVVTGG